MAEVTNEEANDIADDILGSERFISASEPGFFERTVDRVLGFIGDILSDIFGALGGVGGAAGQGFAIVLLVLAAALLAFAIYRAVKTRVPKTPDDETKARVVFDEVVEPEELQAEMDKHVAANNWRGAVIAGFRLGIVGLIDANIAREISGATIGDFALAVQNRQPDLITVYDDAARSFERAFYSDIEIGQPDMERVRNLLSHLENVSVATGAGSSS